MSAQEFILIPKENYIKKQPKASEILDDPTITAKSQQLTLLQRVPEKRSPRRKKRLRRKSPRDTRRYPEKGTSLNHYAQSQSN